MLPFYFHAVYTMKLYNSVLYFVRTQEGSLLVGGGSVTTCTHGLGPWLYVILEWLYSLHEARVSFWLRVQVTQFSHRWKMGVASRTRYALSAVTVRARTCTARNFQPIRGKCLAE